MTLSRSEPRHDRGRPPSWPSCPRSSAATSWSPGATGRRSSRTSSALATQMVVFAFIGGWWPRTGCRASTARRPRYVEFVAIGIVVNLFVQIALTRTATAIRTEQMIGTLEALLMTPTATATVQLGSAVFDLSTCRSGPRSSWLPRARGGPRPPRQRHPAVGRDPPRLHPVRRGASASPPPARSLTFRRGDGGMMVGVTLLGLASGAFFPLALLPAWIAAGGRIQPARDRHPGRCVRRCWAGPAGARSAGTSRCSCPCPIACRSLGGVFLFKLALGRERRRGTLGLY